MAIFRAPCEESGGGDAGAIRGAVPCSKAAEPWVLAATILASGMAFLDGTAVNVALPALQSSLGASVAQVQWVVEGYALFLSALLLVGGSLGDRFGRRKIFLLGVAGFALASAACGLAPTIGTLIAARALQGTAAALLVPGSLALLASSFEPARRGRAIGTWSGFGSITAAVGPLLGGWLIDHTSWRWIFAINLPLALAVIVISLRSVPESRDPQAGPLDPAGAVLATLGLGGLTYGLIEASRLGWSSPAVLVALAVGGLAVTGFVLVEMRVASPMMPLHLFRSRAFAGANLLTLWLYAALGGALFFLPFDLIQVHGYSATAAGAALLPFVLSMFTLSRWSGGLVDRYGARLPLIVGPLIAAAGFALFALPGLGGSYWTSVFPAVLVLGFGMAVSVAPLTTTVMGAVDAAHAGLASGINNAVARSAGLIAVAALGLVMVGMFNRTLDRQLDGLSLSPGTQQGLEKGRDHLAAMSIPKGLPEAERQAVRQGIERSFLAGFRAVMLTAAGLGVLAAVSAGFWLDGKGPSKG